MKSTNKSYFINISGHACGVLITVLIGPLGHELLMRFRSSNEKFVKRTMNNPFQGNTFMTVSRFWWKTLLKLYFFWISLAQEEFAS